MYTHNFSDYNPPNIYIFENYPGYIIRHWLLYIFGGEEFLPVILMSARPVKANTARLKWRVDGSLA